MNMGVNMGVGAASLRRHSSVPHAIYCYWRVAPHAACTCICMYIHTYIHTFLHICTHAHTHTHIHALICIYVYICTHTHTSSPSLCPSFPRSRLSPPSPPSYCLTRRRRTVKHRHIGGGAFIVRLTLCVCVFVCVYYLSHTYGKARVRFRFRFKVRV